MVKLTVLPEKAGGEKKVYSFDELLDLQSKLMLVAGKAEVGQMENVDRFVEV